MATSEFDIIQRFFNRPVDGSTGVILGVGDDAAIVQPTSGFELVIAADVLNEGVHFPTGTSAHAIGYKALAVNLSDLAAMGAEPQWFTMTLSLPSGDDDWIAEFSRGLFEIADLYGVTLIGGDTVKGPLSIGIHVIGKVPVGTAMRRDGANVGDKIYVSGTLGDAALALQQLKDNHAPIVNQNLRKKLDYPVPRVQLGRSLRGIASSCIDISDGLVADLTHILSASDVGATVDFDSIPLSNELLDITAENKSKFTLRGGDDYELCFTVSLEQVSRLEAVSGELDIPIQCLGEITDSRKLEIPGSGLGADELVNGGFDHFAIGWHSDNN